MNKPKTRKIKEKKKLKSKGDNKNLKFKATSLRIPFSHKKSTSRAGIRKADPKNNIFQLSSAKQLYSRKALAKLICSQKSNSQCAGKVRENSRLSTEVRPNNQSSVISLPFDSIIELHRENQRKNAVKLQARNAQMKQILRKMAPEVRSKIKSSYKAHLEDKQLKILKREKKNIRFREQQKDKYKSLIESKRRDLDSFFMEGKLLGQLSRRILGSSKGCVFETSPFNSVNYVKQNARNSKETSLERPFSKVFKSQRIKYIKEKPTTKPKRLTSFSNWALFEPSR